MKKTWKRMGLILALCILTAACLPAAVSANSAEPPSLVILINNPPDDLSIVLESEDGKKEAAVRRSAWEGYYVFYSHDLQSDDEYKFKISTGGENFAYTLDMPLQRYNNVYTLDLAEQELTPGTYPFRTALLVSIRLLLTLLLEGMVFWAFGFRQKRSWLVFLSINLITQGALNISLSSGGPLMPGYLILSLLFGEILVFLAEMITFPLFLREHKTFRIVACIFFANVISLIAGGYIITVLPV